MFDNNIPIYEQIKKMILDNIMQGIWKENEMIPSVRQLSTELSVNPNTVMKALQDLQREGILEIVRGLGNKVGNGQRNIVIEREKIQFIRTIIPECIQKSKMLGVSENEFIKILLEHYKTET